VVESLVPITLFMCIAGVLVLRPITKKLGALIEVTAREKSLARNDDAANARIMLLMEQMARRIELIEERLDFTERLVASRDDGAAHRVFPRRTDPRLKSRGEAQREPAHRAG
jgi:hypothetical protein